jgi:hypothetical protein
LRHRNYPKLIKKIAITTAKHSGTVLALEKEVFAPCLDEKNDPGIT